MMNDTLHSIFAGDTSDIWEVGHVTSAEGAVPVVRAVLGANYSCRIVVANAQPPIARVIALKSIDNTQFLAWLTPEETLALGKGTWRVGIELRNPTLVPPLVREIHEVVRIEEGLVPPP